MRRHFSFRYRSAAHWVQVFRDFYGPAHKAFLALDAAVRYARERVQFGKPIGSFQAVKHRCADMLVRLEQARGVAWDAAMALDQGRAGGEPAAVSAAAAGAVALDAFVDVAKDCIQVLGGIGFTWEHDAHLYFKRAKSAEIYLGDATYHRELLAQRIGI